MSNQKKSAIAIAVVLGLAALAVVLATPGNQIGTFAVVDQPPQGTCDSTQVRFYRETAQFYCCSSVWRECADQTQLLQNGGFEFQEDGDFTTPLAWTTSGTASRTTTGYRGEFSVEFGSDPTRDKLRLEITLEGSPSTVAEVSLSDLESDNWLLWEGGLVEQEGSFQNPQVKITLLNNVGGEIGSVSQDMTPYVPVANTSYQIVMFVNNFVGGNFRLDEVIALTIPLQGGAPAGTVNELQWRGDSGEFDADDRFQVSLDRTEETYNLQALQRVGQTIVQRGRPIPSEFAKTSYAVDDPSGTFPSNQWAENAPLLDLWGTAVENAGSRYYTPRFRLDPHVKTCQTLLCVGGSNPGSTCLAHDQCPGGTCVVTPQAPEVRCNDSSDCSGNNICRKQMRCFEDPDTTTQIMTTAIPTVNCTCDWSNAPTSKLAADPGLQWACSSATDCPTSPANSCHPYPPAISDYWSETLEGRTLTNEGLYPLTNEFTSAIFTMLANNSGVVFWNSAGVGKTEWLAAFDSSFNAYKIASVGPTTSASDKDILIGGTTSTGGATEDVRIQGSGNLYPSSGDVADTPRSADLGTATHGWNDVHIDGAIVFPLGDRISEISCGREQWDPPQGNQNTRYSETFVLDDPLGANSYCFCGSQYDGGNIVINRCQIDTTVTPGDSFTVGVAYLANTNPDPHFIHSCCINHDIGTE